LANTGPPEQFRQRFGLLLARLVSSTSFDSGEGLTRASDETWFPQIAGWKSSFLSRINAALKGSVYSADSKNSSFGSDQTFVYEFRFDTRPIKETR